MPARCGTRYKAARKHWSGFGRLLTQLNRWAVQPVNLTWARTASSGGRVEEGHVSGGAGPMQGFAVSV
jgi:hypothetical protein